MSDTKPSTVAEIKAMPEDATVYCFIGTIKARHKRSAGENKRGNWSFETLELRDADGGEIRAKFKDCEPLAPNLIAGARLSILAHKGDKGWTGSKAKDDEYPKDSGKFERILWVTPSAVISLQATPGQPSNRQEQPAAPQSSGDAIQNANDHLARTANLQRLTIRQTFHLAAEWENAPEKFRNKYGETMPLEFAQSINASLFIEGCRACRYQGLPPEPIKAPGKGTK